MTEEIERVVAGELQQETEILDNVFFFLLGVFIAGMARRCG